MKRVNQMRLYRLGNLTRLRELRAGEGADQGSHSILVSIIQLNAFRQNEDNRKSCPASVEKAKKFCDYLEAVSTSGKPLDDSEISLIVHFLNAFETSLEDDLERLPTYVVETVGAYSFDRLINDAQVVFPEKMRADIPFQSLLDFSWGGACLAFDLPTACGFHVFRAADAMLRAYCDHFGGVVKGSGRDWGKYIAALREVIPQSRPAKKKPNIRTIELLDSIRATDRNPLVHPELNLDADGALLMFDLCKNAISLMAMDIKNSNESDEEPRLTVKRP